MPTALAASLTPSEREKFGLRNDDGPPDFDKMMDGMRSIERRYDALDDDDPERKRILALAAKIKNIFDEFMAGPPVEEREKMDQLRARADAVARNWGETEGGPLPQERLPVYQRRLLRKYQKFSPAYAITRFDSTTPADLLATATEQIFADAKEAGRVARVDSGELTTFTDIDGTGRKVITASGDNMNWMQHFMTGGQTCRLVQPEEIP